MSRSLFICFEIILVIVSANAHSWLACTDYTEKGGGTWKPEKCRGFPRGGHRKAPKNGVFGGDTGYDHIPNERNPCQVPRKDSLEYTLDHPMAVYYPGQQVVLVHPMKNHGADSGCTNVHIPDTGSWIYRSKRNSGEDPSLSEFRERLVFDLGRSPTGKDFNGDLSRSSVYPKPGYQNAPKFCDNTDKAMGTYAMNVPNDIQPGKYTFMWLWAFNSPKNLYSTCFEVEIARNKQHRDSLLKRNGFFDTSEPCGGMTSNANVKGNSNSECTPTDDYSYVQMPESPVTTTSAPFFFWQQPSTESWRTRAAITQRPDPVTTEAEQEYQYNPTFDDQDYYDYYSTNEDDEKKSGLSSVDSDIDLAMTLQQFSGEIKLPAPRSTAIRRYYSVNFGCDVQSANFWNCRITNEDEIYAPNSPRRYYEIMQEGDGELQNLHIFYHVNHKEPCDITRFPPYAKLIREEYENI